MDSPPEPGRRSAQVLAAVITWNPDPPHLELCRTLLAGGCDVLVVDNGSTAGLETIEAAAAAGASIVHLGSNTGVSGALRQAHARAVEQGYPWLLTFDQDSVVPEGFVEAIAAAGAVAAPRVALIAPHVVDATSGALLQGVAGRTEPYAARLAITSGALCRVAGLDDVGGFREDLFIDHVDHDVCLRLRRRGWRIEVDPTLTLRHSIGRMRDHAVGAGVKVRTSHHSPDRQYYRYRNYLLLVRDGTAGVDPAWALRTLLALVWGPLKILALEDEKAAKVAAIAAGIRDGLLGRGGQRRQGLVRAPAREQRQGMQA